MKKTSLIHFFSIAIILIATCGCTNKEKRNTSKEGPQFSEIPTRRDSMYIRKEQALLRQLYGKEIPSLPSIISNFNGNTTNIVLITSKHDCVSCVIAGYEIIREISKANGNVKTSVVGLTKEVHIPKNYKTRVFEDKKNELHTEISYAPTALILVMEGNRIIDLHLPDDAKSYLSRNFIANYSL